MILISHRGNINGKNIEKENSPSYIQEALDIGYSVETDIWLLNNTWFLGHDQPVYEINILNIFKFYFSKIYFHCKNLEALEELSKYADIHCFWHQNDDFTLTSNKYIWTYPGKKLTTKSICVLPEISNYSNLELINCAGICSDNIEKYRIITE
jgi:hypothetical protein